MKAEGFVGAFPGRLVPTTEGVSAFVPNPIPRDLELDRETVRYLANAEHAVGELSGITRREFNPYLIGSPLLQRDAIVSSRMEGTVTTPAQLVLLQAEEQQRGRRPPQDAQTREVLNYVEAMEHGLGRLDRLPVCLRLLKEIHEVLLRGVRGERHRPGEFRRTQNHIRGRGSERIQDARFVPPPVPEMHQALNDLEHYLNPPEPIPDPLLIQLALIHYQFEAIHPFRDGNGRIGRLLVPLIMVSRGRLRAPLLYVSSFFESHREAYEDLMLAVSQTGDWKAWIDFVLRGIQQCAQEATEQASDLLSLRERYHKRFQTSRSSALLIKLIDRLFYTPSITINQAAKVLDLTHQGAANNIYRLEDSGILVEVTGKSRYKVFVAPEILRFISEEPRPPSEEGAERAEGEEGLEGQTIESSQAR